MLSETAYQQFKSMIYEGRLRPGQRLVERDLARTFSLSRIPLREALVRLKAEGLVRTVPNSATYVEDFSPRCVLEMYSMRRVLEPLAARLAALRRPPSLVPTLRRLCGRMTLCSKTENWAKLDRVDYQFHHAIVEASQHTLLIRAYDNCHVQITGLRAGYAQLKELPAGATAAEHKLITDCISQGHGRAAERATYDHVNRALLVLEDHFGFRLDDLGSQEESRFEE